MADALHHRAAPGDAGAAPTTHRVLAYGLFAMPLAFAALPLYVQWPAHAASTWGMSLAVLGVLLLAVRVGDAFIDPWIGTRVDALFARSAHHAWLAAGVAAACIGAGMAALMFAPSGVVADPRTLLFWAAAALVLTSFGYSVAMVTHQAWAVRLGGGATEQARWIGAREALALAGVLVASVLPSAAGWTVTVSVLAALLLLAWLALRRVPPAGAADAADAAHATEAVTVTVAASPLPRSEPGSGVALRGDARSPWQDPGFRRLMPVVLVSGLASAIPASLVVLYVRDLLQAGAAAEGWVLGLYFASAAAAMPLWVRAVRRFGLVRPWIAGMCIAIAAFAGAAALGPGDLVIFAFICAASGLALGADLVVPPALLAGLIQRRGTSGSTSSGARGSTGDRTGDSTIADAPGGRATDPRGVEGLWFGWWNFATKLTLAAAAGLALPLVQWLGYSPGARDARSLAALAICYAALPCFIKAAAALLLWSQRDTWPWATRAPEATEATEATKAREAAQATPAPAPSPGTNPLPVRAELKEIR